MSKTKYSKGVAISGRIIEGKEGSEPSVDVLLRITQGPETGRELHYFGSLHENAVQYTVEALRNMGWRCNDITALEGLGSTTVDIREKEEEYEGRKRMRVSVYAPKEPAKEISEDVKKDFRSKFKAIAAGIKPVELKETNKAPEVIPEARTAESRPQVENEELPY